MDLTPHLIDHVSNGP